METMTTRLASGLVPEKMRRSGPGAPAFEDLEAAVCVAAEGRTVASFASDETKEPVMEEPFLHVVVELLPETKLTTAHWYSTPSGESAVIEMVPFMPAHDDGTARPGSQKLPSPVCCTKGTS